MLKQGDCRLVGCELDEQSEPLCHPYSDAVREFPDGHFVFIFEDGNIRLPCMWQALPELTAGGLLVLDHATRYFPNAFLNGFCTIHEPGAAPRSSRWADLIEQLQGWRWLNTTNGIWDNRLSVKLSGPVLV
jgi:hypothetical protein